MLMCLDTKGKDLMFYQLKAENWKMDHVPGRETSKQLLNVVLQMKYVLDFQNKTVLVNFLPIMPVSVQTVDALARLACTFPAVQFA
jgi:hypothetical protein